MEKQLKIVFLLSVALWMTACAGETPAENEPMAVDSTAVVEEEVPVEKPALGPNEFEIQEGDTTYIMKQYFMCFLKTGPNRDQDSATAAQLQADHQANIGRLAEEDKIHMAGPMGDDGDLRGIFVFNTTTFEEADSLVRTDPAVAAGRLAYELHPWWVAKGSSVR